MRALSVLAICVVTLAAAGCIPERDNAHDPSIRPRASFDVLVDGAVSPLGGRNAGWELRSTSSDPNQSTTSLEHAWSLSSSASLAGPWIDVGEGVVVTRSEPRFADALSAIRDFSGTEDGPTFGITQRWLRLDLSDSQGHDDQAFAQIFVVNQPLTVDLGSAIRAAPGGKWWRLADPLDPSSAEPFDLRIEARESDPDAGDAAAAFTATIPAIWTVSGELATLLDLDADGLLDETFLTTGAAGERSVVSFPAPLLPTRGTISVQVGDILDVNGGPVYNTTAEVLVDVGTSPWVADRDLGAIARVESARVEMPSYAKANGTKGLAYQRILASAGDELLLIEGTKTIGPIHVVVVDRQFRELRRRDNVFGGNGALDFAIVDAWADGLGGWWVFSSVPAPDKLVHLDAAMTITASPSPNVEAIAGPKAQQFAPALDGTGDVWECFGSFPSTDRLYRFRPNGTQAIPARDAFVEAGQRVCGAIASDGAGGVWIGSAVNGHLRRFNAAGTVVLDEATTDSSDIRSIVFEPIAGDLWVTLAKQVSGGAEADTVSYRHFTGTVADAPALEGPLGLPPGVGPTFTANLSRRTLMVGANLLSFTFDIDRNLDQVSVGSFFPSVLEIHLLPGGNLVGSRRLSDPLGFPYSLVSIEAHGSSFSAAIPVPSVGGDALRDPAAIAIDPATGAVWSFEVATGLLRRFAANGVALGSIEVADANGGPAIGAHAALAIDRESRRLWLAWTRDPGEGALLAYELPRDPRDAPPSPVDHTTLSGFDVNETVLDLSVSAAGTVCIGENRVGLLYQPGGASFDANLTHFQTGYTAVAAEMKPSGAAGGCFFAQEEDFDESTFDSLPAKITYLDETGASTNTNLVIQNGRGVAYDFRRQQAVVLTQLDDDVSLNVHRWHPDQGPKTTVVVTLADPVPAVIHDVEIDGYWGHAFVAAGSSPGYPTFGGAVIRFSGAFDELDRDATFSSPRLALP